MDVRKFVLMNPVYESNYLPWTTTESETLKALIPGAEVLKPVDLPAVQRIAGPVGCANPFISAAMGSIMPGKRQI